MSQRLQNHEKSYPTLHIILSHLENFFYFHHINYLRELYIVKAKLARYSCNFARVAESFSFFNRYSPSCDSRLKDRSAAPRSCACACRSASRIPRLDSLDTSRRLSVRQYSTSCLFLSRSLLPIRDT